MTEKSLSIQLSLDQELTSCEEASERIVEISLQAPESEQASSQPPLNLALVLDRSGSMNGHKLAYVKRAAEHVLELMQDGDRIAVVQYDDQVDILSHSRPLDALTRTGLQQRLRSIQSGGTTNLSGGWLQGCQEVAEASKEGTVNRTLLLSDGLANVGITDPFELQKHARELAARGVATSTFGVGLDFNHDLLEGMANQGEGRFYFIESAEDIPNLFEEELKELGIIFARDIEVILCCPDGWGVNVSGGWRSERPEPGQTRIHLGALAAGRSREVYCKLTVPAAAQGQEAQVTARVLAKGLTVKEGSRLITLEQKVSLRWADPEELESAPKNEQVLERFAKVDLADQAAEALKLEARGERQRAHNVLNQSVARHRNRIDDDLHRRYQGTAEKMLTGLDERERKRSHHNAYMQKQRHTEYARYPLVGEALGHLVIKHGHTALLDTGSPQSIGFRPFWDFMGRTLEPERDYLGVTTDYLSQVLRTRIDFLLGMDVLQDLWMLIDTRVGFVHFSRESHMLPDLPLRVNLDYVMGIPKARFEIAGVSRMMFVDTSAKLSYLRAEAVEGLQSVDTEKDFYPGFGEFSTEVYQVPLQMGEHKVMLRCGVLPPMLEMALNATQVEGILGVELYEYFTANFSFPRQVLTLERMG